MRQFDRLCNGEWIDNVEQAVTNPQEKHRDRSRNRQRECTSMYWIKEHIQPLGRRKECQPTHI